jgi:hypothetical protein
MQTKLEAWTLDSGKRWEHKKKVCQTTFIANRTTSKILCKIPQNQGTLEFLYQKWMRQME